MLLNRFVYLVTLIGLVLVMGSNCSIRRVDPDYYTRHFPEKKYVRLGEIDTAYNIVGSGPPMLLIHGLASSYDTFDRNIPELEKHFTLYMLDLRGMGYSSKPEGLNYSAATQMQHVLDFMHHFKLQRVSVWGHSMGAVLALELAIYMPEKVDKLIVSAPPVYQRKFPNTLLDLTSRPGVGAFSQWVPMRPAIKSILQDVYEDDKKFVTEERIESIYRMFKLPGARRALHEYVRSIRFDEAAYLDELYQDIQAPTLILWGEKDIWFSPSFGERLHEEIPNSKLVVIPSVGHQVLDEGADLVNPVVVKFLTDSPPSAAVSLRQNVRASD